MNVVRAFVLVAALPTVLAACVAADDDGDDAASTGSAVNQQTCQTEFGEIPSKNLMKDVAKCVVARDGRGLVSLQHLFTDANLDAKLLGQSAAGDSAVDRFELVIDITQDWPRGRGSQFSGGFSGEAGYSSLVQDGYLYANAPKWGGSTNQTGHYLTGVALPYMPNLLAKLSLFFKRTSGESDSKTVLRMLVGHEMVADSASSGTITDMIASQYAAATDAMLEKFLAATDADRANNAATRDARLLDILEAAGYARAEGAAGGACATSVCTARATCTCSWAQGNSMADLRLTMKAFRFAQKMAKTRGTPAFGVRYGSESPDKETAFTSRANVSEWLGSNLGPSMQ